MLAHYELAVGPATPKREALGASREIYVDGADFMMRRLRKGASTAMLSPDSHNAEWGDIIVTDDSDMKIIGTVVWFQSGAELE